MKAPAALRGFDLCRLALEDASLDPTLRKEAVAALGGYLGDAAPEEPDLELTEEWGGEEAAKPVEEEDELELDETWGGALGEDGPAGEAEPESDLELDETWGGEDAAAAEPAEEEDELELDETWGGEDAAAAEPAEEEEDDDLDLTEEWGA